MPTIPLCEHGGCGDRTVANNHQRVASWLRFAGIAAENIPAKPLYEEKLPIIYTSEQIRKLLDVADCYMWVCMLLALKCGLRDKELMPLEFNDINWEEKTLESKKTKSGSLNRRDGGSATYQSLKVYWKNCTNGRTLDRAKHSSWAL
jgi:integrase